MDLSATVVLTLHSSTFDGRERLNLIHVGGHGGDNDFPQTTAVNAVKTSVSCNQNRCGNDYEFRFTKVPLNRPTVFYRQE